MAMRLAAFLYSLLLCIPIPLNAQLDIGASFECLLDECDANTSDEGGDHHDVDLGAHLAEARAQGNGALHRTAFAEVGLRFRPCFSGQLSVVMNEIRILGLLRGFGGGPVIRGDVQVQTILRDITDGTQLDNDVVYEREEDGQAGTTVNFIVDEVENSSSTVAVIEDHTYEYVLRVRARKWGVNGRSDFQTGDRGVSFEEILIFPNLPDSDGDGLFDTWEINGLDEDCDGVLEVDLPQLGADPDIKDLYLELDWMTGRAPTWAAVSALVETFDLAPDTAGGITTPGQGIRLWVDTGDLTDPNAAEDGQAPGTCGDGMDNGEGDQIDAMDIDCLVGDPIFSSLPGGGGQGGGNGFPVAGVPNVNADTDDDGMSDFDETKFDPSQGNFDPRRLRVFRYGISASPGGPPPQFGGQANGNDFVLFNRSAGLLIHEFGHTLGLSHEGPVIADPGEGGPGDGINCKPNYVSVMNYRFQGGIMVAGGLGNGQDVDGDGTLDGIILDYSPPRFPNGRGFAPLTPIDETAWSEANAFDASDSTNFTAWATVQAGATEDGAGAGSCLDGMDNGGGDGIDMADSDCPVVLGVGRLDRSPDWNNDGDANDQAGSPIDFNTAFWNPGANEGNTTGGTCGDAMNNDEDGDGLANNADPDCLGNSRCALPVNAGVTSYSGGNDWQFMRLDPQFSLHAAEGDVPIWIDEHSEEDQAAVLKAMQMTDLAVSQKIAEPEPVVAGQPLIYRMTVENLGPNPAIEVVLVDSLPDHLHYLGGGPACTEVTPGEVECVVGGLEPGDSTEIEIRTRVSVDISCNPGDQFATLTNSAVVENRRGYDIEPANDLTRTESRVLCARYEYAGKFVCGKQTDRDDQRLATGHYRTTTNIHNPNDEDAYFFKKLSFTYPPERQAAGKVVPIGIDRLAYDEALKVDCTEMRRRSPVNAPYVEGYLIVQSPLSLDVDSVYTVDSPVKGEPKMTSLDIEAIGERERKPGPRPDLVVRPAHPEPGIDDRYGIELPEGLPETLFCGENGPNGGPARTVDAIVENIGQGDAAPSVLAVAFSGDAPDAQVAIGAVAAGQSADVSVPIPRGCYGPGACAFSLTADGTGQVIEAVETNNSAESLCLNPAG